MARILIEGFEVFANPEESTAEPEFIRVDVTDMSEEDVKAVIDEIRKLLSDKEHYKIQKHICKHDEGLSCEVEVIEEK